MIEHCYLEDKHCASLTYICCIHCFALTKPAQTTSKCSFKYPDTVTASLIKKTWERIFSLIYTSLSPVARYLTSWLMKQLSWSWLSLPLIGSSSSDSVHFILNGRVKEKPSRVMSHGWETLAGSDFNTTVTPHAVVNEPSFQAQTILNQKIKWKVM